jgi:ApbE superfamily uncharacterized protein (UPF0280 family)
MTYEPRTYRTTVEAEDLVCFEVSISETDLMICAEEDLTDLAEDLVVSARWEIESFIQQHPEFEKSFAPYEVPHDASGLIARMASAAVRARVGPMAAVAGAVAQQVAEGLAEHSKEVIVENGGDLYLVGERDRVIGIHAGASPVSGKVGMRVSGGLLPVSVCTSSGTVGHSMSFGRADAVSVMARDGSLADAVATALANRVQGPEDVQRAIDAARSVIGVLGVLVVVEGSLGAWGNVRLVSLDA